MHFFRVVFLVISSVPKQYETGAELSLWWGDQSLEKGRSHRGDPAPFYRLICSSHATFMPSLPMIWLIASLSFSPLWDWQFSLRDHIWPDGDKRPRGFSKVQTGVRASLLLNIPGSQCPCCPSRVMGQREVLAFGWWTACKRGVQGHWQCGTTQVYPTRDGLGRPHLQGKQPLGLHPAVLAGQTEILLLAMPQAGCHFGKGHFIVLLLHLLPHLWLCSSYLRCQSSGHVPGMRWESALLKQPGHVFQDGYKTWCHFIFPFHWEIENS